MSLAASSPAQRSFATWLSELLNTEQQRQVEGLLSYCYFNISDGDGGWLWIQLRSYETHWVALKIDGQRLQYQCGCKAFKSIAPKPCQHVVAAVTQLQRRNPLQGSFNSTADSSSIVIGFGRESHGHTDRPPAKRLRSMAIAAAAEDVEPYLLQDSQGKPVSTKPRPRAPIWKPHLISLREREGRQPQELQAAWPAGRELLYVIDAPATLKGEGLVIDVMQREPKKAGGWKVPMAFAIEPESVEIVPESDREPVMLLLTARPANEYAYANDRAALRVMTMRQAARMIPLLCRTGRCMLRTTSRQERGELMPVAWDAGGSWDLTLDIRRDEEHSWYVVSGLLRRGEESMPLSQPLMLTAGGLVFWHTVSGTGERTILASGLVDHGAFEWVAMLRERQHLRVPFKDASELLVELFRFRNLPPPQLPEELRVEQIEVPPKPRLVIRPAPKRKSWEPEDDRLVADVAFDYGGTHVKKQEPSGAMYNPAERRLIRRDAAAEAAATARLRELGFRSGSGYWDDPGQLRLNPKHLPNVVRTLLAENWHVEAEGKLYRQPGELRFDVSSGIDWFDLNVTADFGGVKASLPRLLAALRRGESMVQLDDGTFGILPEAWLQKYAPLAGVATPQGDSLRFTKAQAGLLDALLAAQPAVSFDETFRRVRGELAEFSGIRSLNPPRSFTGKLRPYQRESLGWFDFLRRFGFGGCLADDMGLGKTVQVLALLEHRRSTGVGKPSLVVVPRSLIFNWTQEAARFAPKLRVLDQSHTTRVKGTDHLGDYDLVLSTYGTLRRDALYLKDVQFDYVVLDEAQAVKNAESESAKAVRLLRADHRLALSGTPVQNHLGDLWSLFDFLNPGLLGTASWFTGGSNNGKSADDETRQALSRGLRPFILRRTKEQVAPDLPARQEQTLYCELEGEQRKLYDELRDHYRASLLGLIDKQGLGKSKIQILEALLRLRQAACHPALISRDHAAVGSAKLDTLIPQLQEVLAGGHKALIFSQFTQFLTLVKTQLKPLGVKYEYLDGKTKDRQARVERFQNDVECKLFLISLKAGGVGLNLTAADYCFLLDPWWNPAVEAQAIDRTHRIGQTKHVFACRLIARGTVEEKVLALQQSKRELADAIIGADNAVIRTIGRDDLELLLS